MVTYRDVPPQALITAVADKLKANEALTPPAWAPFVKTGVHKEQPPVDPEWWYTRLAAVLRTVAELGPIGTGKLKVKYGGKKRRGYKKAKFRTGSGSVARKALQQLESAQLIKHAQIKERKGRIITGEGQRLLDTTAGEVLKNNGNS